MRVSIRSRQRLQLDEDSDNIEDGAETNNANDDMDVVTAEHVAMLLQDREDVE